MAKKDAASKRAYSTTRKRKRRRTFRAFTLPELVKPDGAGYMPLYCAAQWIATRGGTLKIKPWREAPWREAFKDLLGRIASEDVKVVGVRDGVRDGVPEHISGIHFASCSVDYPFSFSGRRSDLLLRGELCLFSRPYIDDEHWRGGFNDSLEDRRGVRWRRLMVLKADVARCWAAFGTVPGRDAASDEERQVINHAASILKKNPNAKRDDVRSNCQDRFSGLSKRRFDRLWPEARAEAGLSRRAPSGPKPNAGYPRKFPSLLPRAIRRT